MVTDESANPGFDAWEQKEGVEHKFVKTDYDHFSVHRPTTKEDPRYDTAMQFIRRTLQRASQEHQIK